jgi:hypothetical protein
MKRLPAASVEGSSPADSGPVDHHVPRRDFFRAQRLPVHAATGRGADARQRHEPVPQAVGVDAPDAFAAVRRPAPDATASVFISRSS